MIVIIPARSGSKRIKNKNIKLFNDIPIIGRVIRKLKNYKKIKKIIVTSDSRKILKISKKYGADILIKRPKEISNDQTPFQKPIIHAIKKLQNNFSLNEILVVFPCSIFFKISDLNKALKILKLNRKKFVISISNFSHPIQRAYRLKKNKKLNYFFKNNELKRTQDLEKTFYDVGQFYLGNYKNWLYKKIHSNAVGIELPKNNTIDIDYLEDWKHAEKILRLYQK